MNVKRWLLTLLACLLILAALGAYKYTQIRNAIAFAASFPEASATVEAELVEYNLVQAFHETTGVVLAPQFLALKNEIAGRIATVNFSSGQRVKKGAILLQLDVTEEQATLQAAMARASLADIELKRAKKLRAQRSMSEEAVDIAIAQAAVAKAEVSALRAKIEKKTARAPFDAIAGIHSLEPGQILAANTDITSLVGIQNYLWVDFSMPFDSDTPEPGAALRVGMTAMPSLDIEGELIAKAPFVSTTTRNIALRGRIPAHPSLSHNTSVIVKLPKPALSAVRLPATAVRRDTIGEYVFVLRNDAENTLRAYRQPVVLAGDDEHMVIVSDGLKTGDTVATVGAFKLREGILVKLGKTSATELQP